MAEHPADRRVRALSSAFALCLLVVGGWFLAGSTPLAAQAPTLGCCLPLVGGGWGTTCQSTSAVTCQQAGGLVVATCSPNTCPTPPSATFGCCYGSACADLPLASINDLAACQSSGGTPVNACNPGATCPPLGACCIQGLGCTVTNQLGCEAGRVSGTYLGNGTTCGPSSCVAATTTTTSTTTTTTSTTTPSSTSTTLAGGSTTTTTSGGSTSTSVPTVSTLPGRGPAALALLLSLVGFFVLLRRAHSE